MSYDNTVTIKVKATYLVSKKLGGAMFWALDLDDFSAG